MCQIHVFAPIAVLQLLKRGLRLFVLGFCGGNFFRPVTDFQFIELVLRILLLRQRDFPGSFGSITLLL